MKYPHKKKEIPEWTPWFAWHSVPIGGWPAQDGATMVWLEWVERKNLGSYHGSNNAYNYRLPQKGK